MQVLYIQIKQTMTGSCKRSSRKCARD